MNTKSAPYSLNFSRLPWNTVGEQGEQGENEDGATVCEGQQPKTDPLFRVMITLPNKKKRDKTAEEFGEAMMAFLGKQSDQIYMDYTVFQRSLEKLSE